MAKRPLGPKGGKTTRTAGGLVRKVVLIQPEHDAALRKAAYEQQRSESELVREALDRYLGLE